MKLNQAAWRTWANTSPSVHAALLWARGNHKWSDNGHTSTRKFQERCRVSKLTHALIKRTVVVHDVGCITRSRMT